MKKVTVKVFVVLYVIVYGELGILVRNAAVCMEASPVMKRRGLFKIAALVAVLSLLSGCAAPNYQ